jgi:hypothetical protein
MVEQLEKVDPSQLKHDEKLAFWINIYNALLMHVMTTTTLPQKSQRFEVYVKCLCASAMEFIKTLLFLYLHRHIWPMEYPVTSSNA